LIKKTSKIYNAVKIYTFHIRTKQNTLYTDIKLKKHITKAVKTYTFHIRTKHTGKVPQNLGVDYEQEITEPRKFNGEN